MNEQNPLTYEDQIQAEKEAQYQAWLNDQPMHVIRLLELNEVMTIEEALEYLNNLEG